MTEVGYMKIKQITAVFETSPAYVTLNAMERFNCSNDINGWFRGLVDQSKEHFICLHLDSKNRALCVDTVSVGSLNATLVHPREVFKAALLSSASAILLVHNHPSGDPKPSAEDIALTSKLKQGGELLGIRVLDHVIVGENSYHSSADSAML